MFINVAGNYDPLKLKKYAEDLQDRIEELPEITRADLTGAPEREIQINVDKFKMEAAGIGFNDIANAIAYENRDISAGNIKIGIHATNYPGEGTVRPGKGYGKYRDKKYLRSAYQPERYRADCGLSKRKRKLFPYQQEEHDYPAE